MNYLKNKLKSLLLKWRQYLESQNDIGITNGGRIGNKVKLKSAFIRGGVHIGEGTKIINSVHIRGESQIFIGRFTSINGPNTSIFSKINNIKIGSFTSIARGVSIQEFNHNTNKLSTYFVNQNIFGNSVKNDVYSKGDIIIGHDVWIGAQSVIVSGARIGNGAIIGANSVVNGEIPPYAIAAGCPARVLKFRFGSNEIQKIEQLAWWDWPLEKIQANPALFNTNIKDINIDQLMENIRD